MRGRAGRGMMGNMILRRAPLLSLLLILGAPLAGARVAVLAAGQSRRFGPQDKLAAPFGEVLLGEQVVRTLSGLACAHRWVIAARGDHPCAPGWKAAGFAIAVNDQAASGMGSSLALAAQLAQAAGADALLVALADIRATPGGFLVG